MDWTEPTETGIDWTHKGKHHKTGGDLHPQNSMPVPYHEITVTEFMRRFFCGHSMLKGTNYRSNIGELEGSPDVQFYHFHRHTLAVSVRSITSTSDALRNYPGYMKIRREEGWRRGTYRYNLLKFYYVGCEHKGMIEVSHDFAKKELGLSPWGMFCHVWWCPDCGYHYMVDSSG